MYNVPPNNGKNHRVQVIIDGLSALMIFTTAILYELFVDVDWYNFVSGSPSDLQVLHQSQWTILKHPELIVAIGLIIYTFRRRSLLEIRKRMLLLLPVIGMWAYWIIV